MWYHIFYFDTLTIQFDLFLKSFKHWLLFIDGCRQTGVVDFDNYCICRWCRVFCHRTQSDIFLILLQTHCREQGSLFLVIFAMYSNMMGRGGGGGGGMILSDLLQRTRITVFSDFCYVF